MNMVHQFDTDVLPIIIESESNQVKDWVVVDDYIYINATTDTTAPSANDEEGGYGERNFDDPHDNGNDVIRIDTTTASHAVVATPCGMRKRSTVRRIIGGGAVVIAFVVAAVLLIAMTSTNNTSSDAIVASTAPTIGSGGADDQVGDNNVTTTSSHDMFNNSDTTTKPTTTTTTNTTPPPPTTTTIRPTAITATPPPTTSPSSYPDVIVTSILINSGGEAYHDSITNQTWLADVYYDGGRNAQVTNCPQSGMVACSYRLFRESAGGNQSYHIPIPESVIENPTHYYESSSDDTAVGVNCSISLYFLEDYYSQAGMRIFDVWIEDELVLSKLDVFDVALGKSMLYRSIPVPIIVNDSILSLQFVPITSYPVISGIEINCTYNTMKQVTSNQTVDSLDQVTFHPGQLTVLENGLLLSQGLTAKIIATAGESVRYYNGTMSNEVFHYQPDAGATYRDPRDTNIGGWIYLSNSEVRPTANGNLYQGGVGAITFDHEGNIIHYQRVLSGSTANCGGGKTPWDSWISCEEFTDGEIYQVDPLGIRPSEKITMGLINPGSFESFAYDVRNESNPHFFVTKDHEEGEINRFTPTNHSWDDPWSILTGPGILDYLLLAPLSEYHGTYTWTTNRSIAKANAKENYPFCEGIDAYEHELYFVSKDQKMMYILDLDTNRYTRYSTSDGLFTGQPDQIVRLMGNYTVHNSTDNDDDDSMLYFTEDGGGVAGIFAQNRDGQFVSILESRQYTDETTGLSFSPNGMHLYFAYQDNGLLFDVTRLDGKPFSANAFNVIYHNSSSKR